MHDVFHPPKDLTCAKCGDRPATAWWAFEGGTLALSHGHVQPRCEICCLEEQLDHARHLAASIPKLEKRLAELKETP